MKKFILIFIPILLLLSLSSWTNQQNWQNKVDVEVLDAVANGNNIDFLVYMTEQADLSLANDLQTKEEKGEYVFEALHGMAQRSQGELSEELNTLGVSYRSYWVVNAIWTKGDATLVEMIAQRDDVQRIMYNPSVQIEAPRTEESTSRNVVEWGLQMINADDVWAMGIKGDGVTIGGQDTGYDWTHPALQTQYRGWNGLTSDHEYNWHDAIHMDDVNTNPGNPCGFDSTEPCDDNNHGTHTMGTMVGDDNAGNQIGVAPEARWVACRNMEEGWGTPTTYIECFEWFLAPTDLSGNNPDPSKSPHVFANSWACPESEGCNSTNFAVMEAVVDNIKAAGIVTVVSAGNSGWQGCGSINTPAAIFENSFTVGATDSSDEIANYSSLGPVTVDGSNRPKPEISAPGSDIRSSVIGGGYSSFSGTSMAGPHVAGVVALIISANPSLAGQVDIIRDIIEQSAVEKTGGETCGNVSGNEIPNNTYGHGRIDALAAVNAAMELVDIEPLTIATEDFVYPNPFNNELQIEFLYPDESVKFELFNAGGQVVMQKNWDEINRYTVQTANLPKGVYVYRIENGDRTKVGKLVKN